MTNRKYLKIPIIMSIIVVGLAIANLNSIQIFLSLWVLGWTFGCIALIRELLYSKGKPLGEKIILIIFSLMFTATWIGVLLGLIHIAVPAISIFILLASVFMNTLFTYLIQAPTLMGREVMDKIEGFKLYLKTTEVHTIRFATDQECLSYYERYLPYAVALDCETDWTRKFQHIIDRVSTGRWSGRGRGFHLASMGNFSSGLSKGLTRASTTSGSRSSSGGGSSGGGRGSRGGGGW
jgi:uncharacterized membrane protein